MKRLLLRSLAALLAVVLVALVIVRLVYGGGEPYPDQSTTAAVPADEVEVLVELSLPPGNVTAADDGRIFFNTHPFVHASRFADAFLFELRDGKPVPFPSLELQADLQWVFGMTVDRQGRLWVISPATLERERTRLQAFELATHERVVDHHFEPGIARFSQDLRIMPDGHTAILADTGAFRFTRASIIVVDLDTWEVRTVLDEHPSTQPQDWSIQTEHGPHTVGWGLVTFSVGVDGIAISDDGATLYYATMSHDTLFRVPTEALLDPTLSAEALAGQVEAVGRKPLNDGIEVTADGTVLITDVEHGGVAAMGPDGELRTLVALDEVVWADGIALLPDGSALLTDSAIPSYLDPLLRPPALDDLERGRPYGLYRFTVPDRG